MALASAAVQLHCSAPLQYVRCSHFRTRIVSVHTQYGGPRRVQASTASAATTADLKAQLVKTVTRLNSAEEADDPKLQTSLLQLVQQLAATNPTPRPAESELINGRWALLYTLPDSAKGDVKRDPLNTALAAAYDFFYKYVPIIAGSAVGRKADSRKQVKARGQFQTFDTKRGWVGNQARFESFGKEGVINVNGPAEITPTLNGERITAVFTEAELKWGDLRAEKNPQK
eukprot:GHUV01030620.1.p1 GENE.GHUV01030620.1~~GHUV01030620.1.p1  ORF type:complete len:229 (+),score=57.71 GHUV01030620.1:202-888(+)